MPNDDKKIDLVQLIKNAIKQDAALRVKYEIGDKFRFVRDRLTALLAELERHTASQQPEKKKTSAGMAEDETLIYVYLFNAQGIILQTWTKMLTPKLFYEYSVNRPIYTDKAMIESLVRSKENRVQHGYLTIAVKKTDISQTEAKDGIGNPIAKVKEGGLIFDRLICLTHNEQDYVLSEMGVLVKKPLPEA